MKQVVEGGKKVAKKRTAQALLEEAGKAVLDASLQVANNTLAGENVIKSAEQGVGEVGRRMLDKSKALLEERINETEMRRNNARGRKRRRPRKGRQRNESGNLMDEKTLINKNPPKVNDPLHENHPKPKRMRKPRRARRVRRDIFDNDADDEAEDASSE